MILFKIHYYILYIKRIDNLWIYIGIIKVKRFFDKLKYILNNQKLKLMKFMEKLFYIIIIMN